MSDDSNKELKKETGFLNAPDATPMEDRQARPQTNILGPAWRVQFKINDRKVMLDLSDVMIIGRSADGEEKKSLALDLAAFGAYQSGVSRQHAAITRHEGGLYIEDLGSTNGTRINGFQLTARRKYRLRDGDEI
ncbi:FHA domain-containing protein, partial [bacterium]|nr:FHA domain-containing protein [bacterium]